MRCTAVLVTKGNVPLDEISDSIWHSFKGEMSKEVWDNSVQLDFSVFGRYVSASQSVYTPLVYFQDDDCVTSPAEIVAQWEPGKIVCNMPVSLGHRANYENQLDKLVGFGAVCERSLIKETFERYWKHFPIDELCLRECDRIFTGLNSERIKLVDVPVRHLPWATGEDRLYRQADHERFTALARKRVKTVLSYEARGIASSAQSGIRG